VEFCIFSACIQWLACLAVSARAELLVGDMSYTTLVFVLWRPALSASALLSLSSASVTALR